MRSRELARRPLQRRMSPRCPNPHTEWTNHGLFGAGQLSVEAVRWRHSSLTTGSRTRDLAKRTNPVRGAVSEDTTPRRCMAQTR